MGLLFGKQKVLTSTNTNEYDEINKISNNKESEIKCKSNNDEIIVNDNKNSNNGNNSRLNYVLSYLNFGYEEKDPNDDYKYKVFAFGDNDYGCIHYLNKCETHKLFIGNFQCFKGDYGKHYSWGLNNYGQLGQDSYINYLAKNTGSEYFFESYNEVYGLSKIEKALKIKIKIEKMSFGDGFTIALTKSSQIYSWGRCDNYQLGKEIKFNDSKIVNGQKVVLSPILVYEFKDEISSIYSGKSHTLILLKNKKVYGWGDNNKQQIYPYIHHDKNSEFSQYFVANCREIISLSEMNFTQLKTGWTFSSGISKGNEVIIWGSLERIYYEDNKKTNDFIKDVLYEDFLSITPENIMSVTNIAVGFDHILILSNDNKLFSFGNNSYVRFFL